ncbi:MAG: LTA synthase family protein, partial [Myxococcota bacterium]
MSHRLPSWRNVLRRSIYVSLMVRLGLVMLLYTFCRVVFFFYHRDFFPETTYGELVVMMLGGLRFDLSAVLYTNLLYIQMWIVPFRFRHHPTYQRVAMWIFFATNSFALALNCADFVRFPFIHRRTTAAVFDEFAHEGNLPGLIFGFAVDYWPLVLFWIALVAFLIWVYRSVEITKVPGRLKPRIYYLRAVILFL